MKHYMLVLVIMIFSLNITGCGDSSSSSAPLVGVSDNSSYTYTTGDQDRLTCQRSSIDFANSDKSQCLLSFSPSDCDIRYTHQTSAALVNFDADIIQARSYYDACLSGATASAKICTEDYKYQIADALRNCGRVQL